MTRNKLLQQLNNVWVFKLLPKNVTHATFMSKLLSVVFKAVYVKAIEDAKQGAPFNPASGAMAGFASLAIELAKFE